MCQDLLVVKTVKDDLRVWIPGTSQIPCMCDAVYIGQISWTIMSRWQEGT